MSHCFDGFAESWAFEVRAVLALGWFVRQQGNERRAETVDIRCRLRATIEGHVLAKATLTGTYTLNPDL